MRVSSWVDVPDSVYVKLIRTSTTEHTLHFQLLARINTTIPIPVSVNSTIYTCQCEIDIGSAKVFLKNFHLVADDLISISNMRTYQEEQAKPLTGYFHLEQCGPQK